MAKIKRLLRYFVLSLIIVGLIIAGSFIMLCWRIDSYGRADRAAKANVIVIMGALVEENGQPGPDLLARTAHAVELYKLGYAPYIICAGGEAGDYMSAAAVAKRLAISQGVAPEAIWIADGSRNTREDAARAATVMIAQGWDTALVVSHPLHLYRTKLFFEDHNIAVYSSPTTTDLGVIPLRWRVYYTVREAVGVLWPYLEALGLPENWTRKLQSWVYHNAP